MRVAIATLGCKINQYDSSVIRERLAQEDHSFVPVDGEADCYIINTCTVTDRADWEARQLVRRAKRLNPGARIAVTGCYAQVSPEEVARLPGVDLVVGLNRLDDLIRWIGRSAANGPPEIIVGDVRRERQIPVWGSKGLPEHTRAFLKIQEGCNYSCTYCIIPAARGRSRSIRPEEILDQMRFLARQGFMEIVLTGIHLGSYGYDLSPRTSLTAMLEKAIEERIVPRLRLSSLDPREVPDELLDLMARSDILCPHLHICAQAGNDRILKEMRRNYDTATYRDILVRAREKLPDAALGSDIIVGFPGETEEEFDRSLEFFDSLPLTYFHVFPYSPRRGTSAAALPDPVPPAVKKERARKMRALGTKKKIRFGQGFIRREVAVLVEAAVERESGAHRGYSRNYLPVLVPAERDQINHEVRVAVEALENGWLRGKVVTDPVG